MDQDKTTAQYEREWKAAFELFMKKHKDYGSSWRVLRPVSVTDQIFIKAQRIGSIQQLKGEQKISDPIDTELVGIVNYCVIGLVQIGPLKDDKRINLPADEMERLYLDNIKKTQDLMVQKNHDYGEAWRLVRMRALVDLILQKLVRIKQIEDNEGETQVSEGIDAGYQDIINYALFALIRIREGEDPLN